MKRGLLIGLLAALLLCCVPARTENAFEASIVLSSYAGEAETVAIPEEIQGLPQSPSATAALRNPMCSDVTLPETVEFIGEHTVWMMPADGDSRHGKQSRTLATARSPASVSLAYIGEDAFALCPNHVPDRLHKLLC